MKQSWPLQTKIDWVPQWDEDDVVVWIQVAKADRAWRRDPDYYVPEGGLGHEFKYCKFGEWVHAEASRTIWMPHVSLWRYTMHFTDGRHRFAWMRDHGVHDLPVTTIPEQAARLKDWLGTKTRTPA